MRRLLTLALLTLGFLLGCWSLAWADGTESLGPPAGLTVQPGTGVVAAGTGLFTQPGAIEVQVPEKARVAQVLLYWEGQSLGDKSGDDTVIVQGREVRGRLIGGPTRFFGVREGEVSSSAYRADITKLGLVAPGRNRLTVEGLSFGFRNDGAGVVVIYDDGGPVTGLHIRDGDDLAYLGFAPPLDTTVAQRFAFTPSAGSRVATLTAMVASVGHQRPNAVEIDVEGAVTRRVDLLDSLQGNEWDVVTIPVVVPAGAGSLSARVLSAEDGTRRQPASLAWVQTTLALAGQSAPGQPVPGQALPGQPPPAGPVTVQVDDTNDADRNGVFSDDETAPAAGAPVPFRVVVRNPNRVPVVIDALVHSFRTTLVDLLAGVVRSGQATLTDSSCGSLDNAVIGPGGTTLTDGRPASCTFDLRGYAPAPGASVQDTVLVHVHDLGRPTSGAVATDGSTVRTPPGPPPAGAPPRSSAGLPAAPASPPMVVPVPGAAIEVVKIAAVPRDPSGARTIVLPDRESATELTYVYVVTNVGEEPLSRVTLVDDVVGVVSLDRSDLVPGQSATGRGSHVLTPAETERGLVPNRAVARGTTPTGATVQSEAVERVVVRRQPRPGSAVVAVPPRPAPAPPVPAQPAVSSPPPAPAQPVVVLPAQPLVIPPQPAPEVLGASIERDVPAGLATPAQLPRTGGRSGLIAGAAMASVICGAGLLLAGRRRRQAGTVA